MTAIVQDSFTGYCEQLARITSNDIQHDLTSFSISRSNAIFNEIRKKLNAWQIPRLERIAKLLAATEPNSTFISLFNRSSANIDQLGYHLAIYPSVYGENAHLTIKTCLGLKIVSQMLGESILTDKISSIELDINDSNGQTQGSKWISDIITQYSFESLTGLIIRGDGEIHQDFINAISRMDELQHLSVSTKSDVAAETLLKNMRNFSSLHSIRISEISSNSSWKLLSEFSSISYLKIFSGKLAKYGCDAVKQLHNLCNLDITLWSLSPSEISTIATLHQLTSLNIANNEISKASFSKLFLLSSLENLDLYNTHLDAESAMQLENLPHLKQLNVGNNLLDDSILAPISKMDGLRSLNLENTKIKNPDFSSLKKQPITELFVANNPLDERSLVDIHTLSDLKLITLKNIPYSTLKNIDFYRMQSICTLNLHSNNLQARDIEPLTALPHLRQLSLFNNFQLGDNACIYIRQLTTLTELDIGNTGITSIGFNQLGSLEQLHNLRATGNKLDEPALSCLIHLKKLYWADFGKCILNEDSSLDLLKSNIQELWIYNNCLKDNFILSIIKSNKHFIDLDIRGNSYSADSISLFRECYPYSHIAA